MSRIKTRKDLEGRARALQGILDAGESFASLLCKPARLIDEAAAKRPQPTFIESLRTGRKADNSL